MAKILVTGGAGFIGSHLVDRLIKDEHQVLVIDNLSGGKMENLNKEAGFMQFDITNDLTEWGPLDIDYVFHLAAIPRVPYSVEFPVGTHRTNVDGTLNVLEWSRKNHVKKVIFASSSSVYGDQELPQIETMRKKPKSPYALHKAIGEEYMSLYDELYGLQTVSMRFFNVYGTRCDPDSEYSLVIGKFIKAMKAGEPMVIYGDGEQTRDFTHVSDVVEGLVATIKKEVHNEVINLCNGNNISINKIADLIGGEKEYKSARKGDVLHTLGSNNKSKELLDWTGKVTIEEGIKELLE